MRFCMVTTFYLPYHFARDAMFARLLPRALVSQGHTVEVVRWDNATALLGRTHS